MQWNFVGRTEQVDRIWTALREADAGPIVITGERGMGRSAVLTYSLTKANRKQDKIIRLPPTDDSPFSTLSHLLPAVGAGHVPLDARIAAAAAALVEHAGGRRLVIVLDDAHLVDHASMLVLRTLSRQGRALLLLTLPTPTEPARTPDPIDCLRYERGVQTLRLSPLSVDEMATVLTEVLGGPVHPATSESLHAATGGNPGRLHEFLATGLLDCVTTDQGLFRLGDPPERHPTPVAPIAATEHTDRLLAATTAAWRDLALDRVAELCRLAVWRGTGDRVAPILATTLLLRGQAEESARVIDAAVLASVTLTPQLALVKAMSLALGRRDPGAAADFLLVAARDYPGLRSRLLAYRAWLLAVSGQPVESADSIDRRQDRQSSLFWHATMAAVALTASRATEAVGHLRRALAMAEGCRDEVPWLSPFLMACLIDALLLAGRLNEATDTASEFHAGKPGCGWDIAVAISALTSASSPAPATTEGTKAA